MSFLHVIFLFGFGKIFSDMLLKNLTDHSLMHCRPPSRRDDDVTVSHILWTHDQLFSHNSNDSAVTVSRLDEIWLMATTMNRGLQWIRLWSMRIGHHDCIYLNLMAWWRYESVRPHKSWKFTSTERGLRVGARCSIYNKMLCRINVAYIISI